MPNSDASDRSVFGRVPVPLNPLIGREGEVAAARATLARPEVRLLVLTGPGGVGKTRLALQVAHEAGGDFPDGVHFVPLADIGEPALVLPTIAQVLGVAEGNRSPRDRLIVALHGRRALLVLDNFEHVLAAAPELTAVLTACPGVKALVTSRARLQVDGEHAFEVPPLTVPDPTRPISAASLGEHGATRLFVERASAARTDFAPTDEDAATIVEICRRLDGLPRAIELAAARSDLLPPRALLARLERRLPLLSGGPRDRPPRLRAMGDAIAWSYDLLPEPEQALFRRLSVFVGGFSLEAAAAMVAGREAGAGYDLAAGQDPAIIWWEFEGRDLADTAGRTLDTPRLDPIALDPDDGVRNLLRQSLVRPVAGPGEEPRFDLLGTIREFGRERLATSGEAEAVESAHAAWLLAFAQRSNGELWEARSPHGFARVTAELGNARAVLDWAARRGAAEAELALRLPFRLWLYWQTRGLVGEGRGWLERALALGAGPAWDRAQALNLVGLFAWIQGDPDAADAALESALAFWRPTGNRLFTAHALTFHALVAWTRGDIDRMVSLAEDALSRYRGVANQPGVGIALIILGIAARGQGYADRAGALLGEAHAVCSAVGFAWGAATARLYAGEVERDQGDDAAAAAMFEDALDRYWGQGDPWGAGAAIAGLATLAAARREALRAARLFGAADALRDRVGAFLPVADSATLNRAQETVRRTLRDQPFATAVAAGRTFPVEEAITEARRLSRDIAAASNAPPSDDPRATLSKRERQVFHLLAEGRSDKEIATALHISRDTAEWHARRIYLKLALNRRDIVRIYGSRPDPSDAAFGTEILTDP